MVRHLAFAFSVALASLSVACGAPPDPTSSKADAVDPCPEGQRFDAFVERCVYVTPPMTPDSTTPDCHPVTCQVYEDWSMYGDGGAAAGWCAGACDAHCQGDVSNETYDLEQAKVLGTTCAY